MDIQVTGEMTPQQRRLLVERQNAVAANTLLKSGAWDWFEQQCEAKAQVFERAVLDMAHKMDPRDEDRFRGAAEAFRGMPRMVRNEVKRFNKKVAAANAAAQSQQGDQR